MPNRDIKESCRTSETLAKLTHGAERFCWRLTTYADDWGRFPASAPVLRAHCFALMLDTVSEADVAGWLGELQRCDMVRIYADSDGKMYGEFITWRKHQRVRAKFSKYPAPTPAGICRQMTTDVPVVTEETVVTGDPVVAEGTEKTETPALTTSAPALAGAGRRISPEREHAPSTPQGGDAEPLAWLDLLNREAGREFKAVEANLRPIRARIREQYRFEDAELVVGVKVREWRGTDQEQYLRPVTIFGPKFDGYLQHARNGHALVASQSQGPVGATRRTANNAKAWESFRQTQAVGASGQ